MWSRLCSGLHPQPKPNPLSIQPVRESTPLQPQLFIWKFVNIIYTANLLPALFYHNTHWLATLLFEKLKIF
mgnify:FL=1